MPLKNNQLFAKKSFGQHFLVDNNIKRKIIEHSQIKADEIILEIGPGKGAMTKLLLEKAKRVIAVEADPRMVEELQKQNIEVIHSDFLKFATENLPSPIKVVSNLPYNVATPIIEKLLTDPNRFKEIYVMVQLEHGLRMLALPGSKDYGSLSCFVQYHAAVKKIFNIKPNAFHPRPKVDSCFLHLHPIAPPVDVRDKEKLFSLIQKAFQQRRKNILNALNDYMAKDKLELLLKELRIKPNARPEDLSLQDFAGIVNGLTPPSPL